MEKMRLEAALEHSEVELVSFLGEGAWHHAWQVQKGKEKLVLRIPKTIAYGKNILFDKAAFQLDLKLLFFLFDN